MAKVDSHAHPNAVRTLIGNKLDSPARREVPTVEALDFAALHNMDFCEVSAKSGRNVEVALRRMIMSVACSLLGEEEGFRGEGEGEGRNMVTLSMPELDDSPPYQPQPTGSVPLGITSPIPRGWVSVEVNSKTSSDSSVMYENIWTGERVSERPKERAGQGKVTYGRTREELEKVRTRVGAAPPVIPLQRNH